MKLTLHFVKTSRIVLIVQHMDNTFKIMTFHLLLIDLLCWLHCNHLKPTNGWWNVIFAFICMQIHENINLFHQARINILSILNEYVLETLTCSITLKLSYVPFTVGNQMLRFATSTYFASNKLYPFFFILFLISLVVCDSLLHYPAINRKSNLTLVFGNEGFFCFLVPAVIFKLGENL